MEDVKITMLYGNAFCLREICNKIDPDYNFPTSRFNGYSFGENKESESISLELHLHLVDGELKIKKHIVDYLKSGASSTTMVQGDGSPGFEL